MTEGPGNIWHAMEGKAVLEAIGSREDGLAPGEAARRLAANGKNVLSKGYSRPWWRDALHELTEPMILLLFGIGVLYSLWG